MTDRRALFHNGLLRILGVAVAAALIGLAVPMVGQPLGMTIPFGIQLPGIEASVDLTSLPFPQASAYVGSGILFGILGAILLAVALLPARRGPAMLLLKPASD
ncbi:MAG: hypothetical protein HKN29_13645, partial [Rhodothermales bacterium]|nr:hypothetical protein [Rhodothermales bacterium]